MFDCVAILPSYLTCRVVCTDTTCVDVAHSSTVINFVERELEVSDCIFTIVLCKDFVTCVHNAYCLVQTISYSVGVPGADCR